jgi:hypothetical protein
MKTISRELQNMINVCMQYKLSIFLERVDISYFPKTLHPLIDIIGIDMVLQICLLTDKLRIPKREATLKRNLRGNPIYTILLTLPSSKLTSLLKEYRGCRLDMPHFATLWNRVLKGELNGRNHRIN